MTITNTVEHVLQAAGLLPACTVDHQTTGATVVSPSLQHEADARAALEAAGLVVAAPVLSPSGYYRTKVGAVMADGGAL